MQILVCPCCQKNNIESFFRLEDAPIYSVATVKSKEDALAVPKRNIELGFCHDCGFVFNRLYSMDADYFTMGYEDQQGFSKTFMQYLTRVSTELILKYSLEGKTLLEIGCGKGDFINLLNELAGGQGIGIDPAYVDGRQNNPRLTFYKEFYSENHGKLPADFICCRHTLEHISPTRDFLRLIRVSLGQEKKPVIFFEVPQISRILDIQAFWDIYYEHCSYFSAGSFGRLLRDTGYEVLDMRLDYDDQYLLVEVVPSEAPVQNLFAIEESIDEQKERIESFKVAINIQLEEWRKHLNKMKEAGNKVVLWGGGSKAVGFLTNFSDLNLIDYVVDINPNIKNNYIPGIGSKYVQPEFLRDYRPDAVIIMNSVYEDEISKTINEMGLYPDIHSL